jgi:hypothetical protein
MQTLFPGLAKPKDTATMKKHGAQDSDVTGLSKPKTGAAH